MISRLSLLFLLVFSLPLHAEENDFNCPKLLNYSLYPLIGEEPIHLCSAYRDKVLLVVNTASKCAVTPRYDSLEKLYEAYKSRGLVVLGFPSNDFGGQEPGQAQEIAQFCRLTYGVRFPMFEKTRVAQGNASPFFRSLAGVAGEYPRWNFHKYLIDRTGQLIGSFPSRVEPLDTRLITAIQGAL